MTRQGADAANAPITAPVLGASACAACTSFLYRSTKKEPACRSPKLKRTQSRSSGASSPQRSTKPASAVPGGPARLVTKAPLAAPTVTAALTAGRLSGSTIGGHRLPRWLLHLASETIADCPRCGGRWPVFAESVELQRGSARFREQERYREHGAPQTRTIDNSRRDSELGRIERFSHGTACLGDHRQGRVDLSRALRAGCQRRAGSEGALRPLPLRPCAPTRPRPR
jgi:hypothetical protein